MKKRIFLIAVLLAVTAVLTVGCKKTQEVPKDSISQEDESGIVLPEQDLDEEEDKKEESNKKPSSNKKEDTSSKNEDKKEDEDNEENEPQISDGKIELPMDRW